VNEDLHLQNLLAEINAYIDNMPSEGSTDHLRLTEALGELLSHRDALDQHPHRRERIHLRKIEVVLRRHSQEEKTHDRALGFSGARAPTAPSAPVDRRKP
jgi:hypothetical protein